MSSSSSVSPSKLSAKELFDKHDLDKSGTISFKEFQKMLPDLGIHLSTLKQIEYFRLCDKDGSGQIDYDEFKVALFICTEEINHAGFNAGTILRPKDAFEMFDKDGSGKIDEVEFHFLLKYLNIDIDESTHEQFFRRYDLDKSGFIEYQEFKRAWLRLANTRKELESRGIEIPTLATKFQMINMLDKILEEEEEQERKALEETKRWRLKQDRLKEKRVFVTKARHQARVELCSALDAGGSVYVFGSGSLEQFTKPPRRDMNNPFFLQHWNKLIISLWKIRVGNPCDSKPRKTNLEEDLGLNMNNDYQNGDLTGLIRLDNGLNIQDNTFWLWGRQCERVAASDSILFAYCPDGLYAWGGNTHWWNQLETESILKSQQCGELTARSNTLLGCPANCGSDRDSEGAINLDQIESIECHDELARHIQTVLQYYNSWSLSEGSVDYLDHAKTCLRSNVEIQRIAFSLHLRGKSTEGMTKIDMVKTLHDAFMLEFKFLGESAHLELRELEQEMIKLRQQQKLKLVKRRQNRFNEIWRSIREEQRLETQYTSHQKKGEIKNQSVSVKRCERSHESNQKGYNKKDIFISGITPRGPQPTTMKSSLQWKMIDAGANQVGVIDDKNRLFMWGTNTSGQLGRSVHSEKGNDEEKMPHDFEPKVIDLPGVNQFSCGHSHTAAVNENNDLFVWGSASCGKLGLGNETALTECYSSTPLRLKSLASKRVVVVSCGSSHTACVEGDMGGLYVWGNGGGGRLGLGHNKDVYSPVLVKTIQEYIVNVSCGNCQTLATTRIEQKVGLQNESKIDTINGGRLYVAGSTEVLGDDFSVFGTYDNFLDSNGKEIDLVPINEISAGFSHQSAISLDGELFLWGDNYKGCCGQDQTKVHFIPCPRKVKLYEKPEDLAKGKSSNQSVSYGDQPFYDVDLGQIASICEIKLWNCLSIPNNPAINKSTYTARLFPCWIMISPEPFPDNIGEGNLEAALKLSTAKKRFEENQHESYWRLPRGTKGRVIRVQMEGLNLMEFDKLQVFGSFQYNPLEKVTYATCGKRVTAAIVGSTTNHDDIIMMYKRAIAADPSNADILNQFDLYKDIALKIPNVAALLSSSSLLKIGCILCNGRTMCPFCQMKNEFSDLLSLEDKTQNEARHSNIHLDGGRSLRCLEDIINLVLTGE